MDSYYHTNNNNNTSNSSSSHRHSTPLSPLRETQKCNGSAQDTNYVGITITDQEDTSRDWVDAPPSYRHSFNGLTDLYYQQQSFDNTHHYQDTFQQEQQQQQHQEQQQQQHQEQQTQSQRRQGSRLDKSTLLSRHASITLPAINTSHLLPNSTLSTSTLNRYDDGPRSATLPLQHSSSLLSSSSFSHGLPQSTLSSSLVNRSQQSNSSSQESLPIITHHQTPSSTITTTSTTTTMPSSTSPSYFQQNRTFRPSSPFSIKTHTRQSTQQQQQQQHHQTSLTVPLSTSSSSTTSSTSSKSSSHATHSLAHSSSFASDSYSGAFRKVSHSSVLLQHYLKKSPPPTDTMTIKPLISLTKDLNTTYQKCNHGFQYSSTRNPRRVLTKPSKPGGNDGYDNEDFDYILYVNDILGSTEGHRYVILDVLGAGTFGQVVKCKNTKTQELFAVKVVKNKLAYFKQSMMEVTILEMLNQRYDANDQHHILRLKDTFIHRKHLCLVFELMSVNLYELIKQNQFRGLSTNLVRVFTAQILDSLTVLNEARIIHCDLKPENILLKNLESPTIKVIDFGSACHEVQTMYTYIQSRFYRSPEVLVGLPYTSAIDMWSLGCIAAELFLGLPLFPGSSEYNQVSRIIDMLGLPPSYMIEMGKNSHRYFERRVDKSGQKHYRLRSMEQYAREQGKQEQPSKRYFSATTLPELITTYPLFRKDSMSPKELEKETQSRLAFVDFLQGLLNLNHFERWSPQQAKQHPFITGEPFTGHFAPPFISRSQPSIKIPPPMPHISLQQQADPSSSLYQQKHHQQPSPQLPLSINDYGEPDPRYPLETQQPYLSPAYSSLPNFYTDQLAQQQRQQQQQQVVQNNRSQGHSDVNVQKTQPAYNNSLNKRSSYTLPRVLEPPEDEYDADNSMNTDFIASPSMYQQQQFHLQQQKDQQQLSMHATSNGRPRANTVGTMQVPPPIQLATIDAVSSNTEGRKLGSISERQLQPVGPDDTSLPLMPSPLLQQQYDYHLQQQQQQYLHHHQSQRNQYQDTSYAEFQGIQVDACPSSMSTGTYSVDKTMDANSNCNGNSNSNSISLTSSSAISSTIPSLQSAINMYQETCLSSSTALPIDITSSSMHHRPQYYSSSDDHELNPSSIEMMRPEKLQQVYSQQQQQQQQQQHQRGRLQDRPLTWRSSIGNMPSIDLERDADWTEDRSSPPLELTSSSSTSLTSHAFPSSSTSPLPFAHMSIRNSTSTSRQLQQQRQQQQSSHHRRSHSSVRFSDVMPSSSISTSSTTSTSNSSVISRSSMASNVASLHRRVRGHPPLVQPYHRQDLEWDGIHSIPSYQHLQQQQQVNLTPFHHRRQRMTANEFHNT